MNYKTKQVINDPQPGRNDKCPCGSGKKFKKCCQVKLNQLAKVTLRGQRAERRSL